MNEEILTQDQFVALAQKAETDKKTLIAIFQDTDGNWRGAKKIGNTEVYARQSGPETVLQLLLTHDGTPHTKTE